MRKKIKLELKQPQIKCSGREDVSCFYRGYIIGEGDINCLIEFKYKGEVRKGLYNKILDEFHEPELKDIKLK